MGDSSKPWVGQEGLAAQTVPCMDYPLVSTLLEEFVDVFSNLVFPPNMYFIYNIDFIDLES